MKKRLIAIIAMAVVSSSILLWTIGVNCESYGRANEALKTASSTFGDGWRSGWKAGWKQVKGRYSIAPVAPVAPVPKPGENTFQDGYNRGFLAGIRRAQASRF